MITRVPATDGAHYTSTMGYPEGWADASPSESDPGVVFIEVGTTEGYTLARLTPADADALGMVLTRAAQSARERALMARVARYDLMEFDRGVQMAQRGNR